MHTCCSFAPGTVCIIYGHYISLAPGACLTSNIHYSRFYCGPGIPSYVRGIKYPGIFRSYHPENAPRSSRILRQLVCTDTCMGFNGILEPFFHLRTPYEALFCSQSITLLQ